MSETIMVGFEICEEDTNMDEMQVMTTTINSHVASLAHELHMDILSVSHSTFNFDAKGKDRVDVWRVYVTVVYQSNGQTASGIW